ncbi:Lrp/AsnC family transcriptional regulator [Naumannella halotolerans]|uniref:Lrp/AsnC family leucine-responsive transcriptional regulator n=1 Tax=Naumannella halotolerans TaxID=993414 RepID=A0A4V3ENL3_9ACTN|nr:Lrp/AsnC family transcriptional regulator [Naumannella halotolerans]TDT33388.1 Lrp/AsnC family leucine-responsive transcriptional regulator [Naumannella halotolerans]
MEETDRKILALLAADGRMSYTDIGKHTGLSTSAAQQRVRRLEQRGVITGYHARIDPAALDRTLTAFIAIRPLNPSLHDDLPERMSPIPEIVSCYSVAGDSSYLLKVQVEHPLALEGLLARIRTELAVATLTTLVLSVPFEDRVVL